MTALLGAALAIIAAFNLGLALLMIVIGRPFGRTAGIEEPAVVPDEAAPFVSVHVAAHDEPPSLVIATLAALANLDYPAFEIVVIDNNTPDPATWHPVAGFAATLGPRVKFRHCMGVVGAKAGALNIALEHTDARAAYVAIVDADYLVSPDFLSRAVAACGDGVEFVQFPQVYRNADRASAVVAGLADYFETFPRAANGARAALLTGTLSLIAVEALRAVGGWPTRSITEDAELGVRLWSSGRRGVFIPRQVGEGLLPVDVHGLRLQRRRWVGGNVQTLIGAAAAIRGSGAGRLAVVAQLTAWIGFLAIPLLALAATAVVRATHEVTLPSSWRWVEGIAASTIAITLAAHLARSMMRKQPASFAVTMALLWTGSFGWLAALGVRPLRFRRTPKVAGGGSALTSIDTLASLAALATAIALGAEGAVVPAAVLTLSAGGLVAAPLVDRWLRTAAAQEAGCAA